MPTLNFKELTAVVTEDIRCHSENGVDLNPYSTDGARWSWQNGFEGKKPVLIDRYDCHQRGQMAAKLLEEPSCPT